METQITQCPNKDYCEKNSTPPIPVDSAVAWSVVFAGAATSATLSLILLFRVPVLALPWYHYGHPKALALPASAYRASWASP